ncbi:hypothetical protein BSL78_29938 [Apostichopus japonicus]|uniref:Uncharacterized protein n=1 Tax=Stichopus japonicus TaxID=307972 RepID=A0A2G8JBY3_STIJA|nr:hypothetical protein BSL78_29938 [Apostichopus japonicus]
MRTHKFENLCGKRISILLYVWLKVIASGVAKSPTDVQWYSSSTLLAASLSSEDGDNPDGKATSSSSIDACISFLREQEFIRLDKVPLLLGKLSTDKRRVAELVGVEERFLIRAAKGNVPTHTARQQHLLSVHRRFHTALILEELVNEAPLNQVARKYGCSKGQLQSLQQSASTFAGMVTVFCSKLGWYNLELLLAQFQNRLNFGVQRELVDLVRISLLNAQRARLLYNSGLTNPASVATASPREVERILRNAVPFKSGRQAVDEKDFEAAERRAARCIWASGKKGLTEAEAAELIVMEAKHIVRAELGSIGIEWNPRDVNKKTVELDCESGDQTGDLNKDGKGRMGRKEADGAKTGRKDEADNNGEGSYNEMEMETDQSKPQEVKHRVVNLGEECKEQMGSTSKKGVVVKDINDKSQRSKVGKDQQAARERVDLGKTSTGSNFPRKNSGLKVKGLSVVHQQSVLVGSERNKPVQSKTKFVPYSKGAVKDGGAVKQICVEEKTCENVDKGGGHVAVSRDVNKAEVRNQFNKNKSGSAEMKNKNGKTQLTDKVERKLTVDEDRNQDHDDREDGKRDICRKYQRT